MQGALTTIKNSITTAGQFHAELFQYWTAYIDATPKTVQTYTRAIKQFYAYMQRNGITEPRREDVISYREELKENRKPATVQAYITAVKLFFKWTEETGLYPNIADHIKGAKIDHGHKKDYLTATQAKDLLNNTDRDTLKGKRDFAILCLMLTTGLRTVSVINADIKDIRTAGDSVALYYRGKGHEEKSVYVKLSAPVEKAIREYLQARGEKNPDAPLFGSIARRNNGERMTTRSISRIVKGHLIETGLESDRLTAHSLRHTAATLNLLNGATLEETRQLLDHKDINTTLIYSHALKRADNKSEERISAILFV